MANQLGFLEYERQNDTEIPPQERIENFHEFHTPLNFKNRRTQAERCMNCGVPLCQSAMKLSGMVTGCPLHNFIPEWNNHLVRGNYEEAYKRLHKTSNFPEFTGRVCPSLCEKACMDGQYGDPVTVHENEQFIIETAYNMGFVHPEIPAVRSGKKVAVVGSGPAGLAVADVLNHRGHSVTVFERDDRIGGLLMYGIPNMKLDKDVIFRRQALMEEEGVVFETGVNVGDTPECNRSAKELLKEFDAVVLCCGAKNPRPLGGYEDAAGKIPGVYYAVDFLTHTTKHLLQTESRTSEELLSQKGLISAKGKHVIVVGGGDTGNDCIGTSIREQCKSLTALEMMPAPPAERSADNPWPEWPKVLKTDYGHSEAISVFGSDPRVFNTTVKELITDKRGILKKVKTVQVKFVKGKLTEIEGTEKILPCDLLLIAAGFIGCQPYTAEAFKTPLSPRGTVLSEGEGSYKTKVDKVFTAGDMHRGQSLVVWAIAEGRECAREVDEYLMGYSTL